MANLTLDGLEKTRRKRFPKATRESRRAKVNLIRWADDFIITGSSKELLEQEVKPLVAVFLQKRGVELSPEKTRITPVEGGFDFLGQHVRKYGNGKIIIKPSVKNRKAFLRKVRQVIKGNGQAKTGNLIAPLNPMMRGWANYHRHAASKRTFVKIAHAIFQMLWRWASRRHPKKRSSGVKAKYVQSIGQRNWECCGELTDGKRKFYPVWLVKAADVTIKRHVKIKGEANPYDPAWEQYVERRLGMNMADSLKGRRQLLYLWQQQGGICPIYQQKITTLRQLPVNNVPLSPVFRYAF